MNDQWGLCKDCKWWQIEPGASAENLTLGLCIDEDLQRFRLRVSGNSGCNRYMPAHRLMRKAPAVSRLPPTRNAKGRLHRVAPPRLDSRTRAIRRTTTATAAGRPPASSRAAPPSNGNRRLPAVVSPRGA